MRRTLIGTGRIIARFENGEVSEVETLLKAEGEYEVSHDTVITPYDRTEISIDVSDDDIEVVYPDECKPEHDYPITEIVEVIDSWDIDWRLKDE